MNVPDDVPSSAGAHSAGWQKWEDALILEHIEKNCKNGQRPQWSNMSKFVPGRTGNGCRNRFQRIEKSRRKFGEIVDGRKSGYRCNSRVKEANTAEVTMNSYDTSSASSSDEEDGVLLLEPYVEALPYESQLGVDTFHPTDFDYSLGDDIRVFNYETWDRNMASSMRSETPFEDLMEAIDVAWCQVAR
jgi:hypothetical protein